MVVGFGIHHTILVHKENASNDPFLGGDAGFFDPPVRVSASGETQSCIPERGGHSGNNGGRGARIEWRDQRNNEGP